MTLDTNVLILGAGPVGMTLANELKRHGVTPRIVDKAPSIREVSKAMILHVRTQEVLDKVGVEAKIQQVSQPLKEVVVHAYGKHIGSWDLDEIDSPFRHPVIIGQNRTQHILLDQLTENGVHVEWNTEAISFELAADCATTVLRNSDGKEETVRAGYVVGCEGSNSMIRRTLNFSFEGERYSGEQFIQADCRIKWSLPKGRSYLFLTAEGYMMVIEFPDDVVRVFISLPDASVTGAQEASKQFGAVEATNEEPTLEEIHHHLERLSGYSCELSDPIWLARYRTSHRYTNHFSQGRAFIAGDAAHVHVPIGGQGMNTGIQDAFNLGWKLAGVVNGNLHKDILASYHSERHPVAENLINGTNFAYKGILHPSEARQRATRLFGPFLIRNERVQDFMRSTLEELKVFYPHSPLNLNLGGSNGPKPGERVLDSTMVRASDIATVTLNELTANVAWTLLLFSGMETKDAVQALAAFSAEITNHYSGKIVPYLILADKQVPQDLPSDPYILLDALHTTHHRYGISNPGFYLLRPDTYVSARGPIAQKDQLLSFLKTLFA